MFENLKRGTNDCRASCLLFKYYISQLDSLSVLTVLTQGGVEIYGKHADVILKCSLNVRLFS